MSEDDDMRNWSLSDLNVSLLNAASMGDEAQAVTLLGAGAHPYHQEEVQGLTPLMIAALKGHSSMVALLLSMGAPWHALDVTGKSAGDYAVAGGSQEIVDMIVSAGVEAEANLRAQASQEGRDLSSYASLSGVRLIKELWTGDNSWRSSLHEAHLSVMAVEGKNVLVIGNAMPLTLHGLVQSMCPATHTIVEASPEAFSALCEGGWCLSPENARMLPGTWVENVGALGGPYDVIYVDYFQDIGDLERFHTALPSLLAGPGSVYSFFNAVSADNHFFQGVACQVISNSFQNKGYTASFLPVTLDADDGSGGSLLASTTPMRLLANNTYYLPLVTPKVD